MPCILCRESGRVFPRAPAWTPPGRTLAGLRRPSGRCAGTAIVAWLAGEFGVPLDGPLMGGLSGRLCRWHVAPGSIRCTTAVWPRSGSSMFVPVRRRSVRRDGLTRSVPVPRRAWRTAQVDLGVSRRAAHAAAHLERPRRRARRRSEPSGQRGGQGSAVGTWIPERPIARLTPDPGAPWRGERANARQGHRHHPAADQAAGRESGCEPSRQLCRWQRTAYPSSVAS